jgi:hypothetical protein
LLTLDAHPGDYEVDGFHRKGDSTLFDLLEFAYKNDTLAVNAVYHFRRELNRITEYGSLFPLLSRRVNAVIGG